MAFSMPSVTLLKCKCNHCGQFIEFPDGAVEVDAEVLCPHCGLQTQLDLTASEPASKPPPLAEEQFEEPVYKEPAFKEPAEKPVQLHYRGRITQFFLALAGFSLIFAAGKVLWDHYTTAIPAALMMDQGRLFGRPTLAAICFGFGGIFLSLCALLASFGAISDRLDQRLDALERAAKRSA